MNSPSILFTVFFPIDSRKHTRFAGWVKSVEVLPKTFRYREYDVQGNLRWQAVAGARKNVRPKSMEARIEEAWAWARSSSK